MCGCLTKVGILTFKMNKIGPETKDIVIFFALNSIAYRFLILKSNHILKTNNA